MAEVAAVLGVSKMTVYRMLHAGELPALRVSGSWRIPPAALREILDGGEAGQAVPDGR